MNTRQLLGVELIAQPGGVGVTDLAGQGDRFGYDVIRRQSVIREPQPLEGSEHVNDAFMVYIPLRDQREEESRVEEGHAFGWPYR